MLDYISTLPHWLVVALLCALLGGVSGIAGWSLERSGKKWGRFIPIAVIAFSVSFASQFSTALTENAALTPERTGELIKQVNPRLYGFIETTYPDEYLALTTKLTELSKSGKSAAEIGPQAAEAMAEIRRRHAPMVAMANDEDQSELVEQNVRFYKALQSEDPMLCNAVAADGPVALMGKPGTEALMAMVEPQALSLLKAAAGAEENPTQRKPATEVDWQEVGEQMSARGATQAQFDAVFSLDQSKPELCSGLILLMQTLNAVDSEAVKAVRSEYLTQLSLS